MLLLSEVGMETFLSRFAIVLFGQRDSPPGVCNLLKIGGTSLRNIPHQRNRTLR
jgi:hypothetical protein